MKLLIVRHGDPDYTIDSLTEKGWKEVEFLSEKLSKLDIKDFYVSPLGRAKDTASLTLKKMNRTATECDWLREFDVLIDRPDVTDRKIILWDWLPQDWSMDERFYQYDHWFENERLQAADTKKHYDYVTGEFDKLLAEHGYVREGHYYIPSATFPTFTQTTNRLPLQRDSANATIIKTKDMIKIERGRDSKESCPFLRIGQVYGILKL